MGGPGEGSDRGSPRDTVAGRGGGPVVAGRWWRAEGRAPGVAGPGGPAPRTYPRACPGPVLRACPGAAPRGRGADAGPPRLPGPRSPPTHGHVRLRVLSVPHVSINRAFRIRPFQIARNDIECRQAGSLRRAPGTGIGRHVAEAVHGRSGSPTTESGPACPSFPSYRVDSHPASAFPPPGVRSATHPARAPRPGGTDCRRLPRRRAPMPNEPRGPADSSGRSRSGPSCGRRPPPPRGPG